MNDAINSGTSELADLLAVHLQDEEAVLAAALPMVRALQAAFTRTSADQLPHMAAQHHAIASLLSEIGGRRQRFRELVARRLGWAAETITINRLIADFPARIRDKLAACVASVRRMAKEFVAINRWLIVHLRIHLDAYQRLLSDLTGTGHRSGRYGPAGTAEMDEFRPMIQVQG